jgi:fatty acid desaturase
VCIFGVALLGGRQLALAICTHEAAHRTLFASRWLNDWPTDWLCGRPIGLDLKKYRDHHFIHHTKTGTENDPDISLIEGLPTTKVSLARKFARDLVGVTGLKFIVGRVLMDAGLLKWTVASKMTSMPRQTIWQSLFNFIKNFTPTLITNLLLYLVLAIFGHPELYLFWILAYIIPYPLFIRIRALAEHACTERSTDMFLNTRTTRAGIIARAFFAPLNVNYHIEHHAMASVPWHNLPEMHRLLREKNIVDSPPSYWDVLIIVSSKSNSI